MTKIPEALPVTIPERGGRGQVKSRPCKSRGSTPLMFLWTFGISPRLHDASYRREEFCAARLDLGLHANYRTASRHWGLFLSAPRKSSWLLMVVMMRVMPRSH